jgi:phosphate acyltransferase
MTKIGIDAMGGDFAPRVVVEGSVMAINQIDNDTKIVLIGQTEAIQTLLKELNYNGSQIEIVHADDVIGMGEHPTKGFSQKPHSSIAVGFKMLKNNELDIFCSAGNTGAMHVGALFTLRAIEGVLRPAIAGIVPQTNGGHTVLLDVGANADCKPDMLEQFAELGSIFAKHTLNIENPRVALMNIGEEEKKGSLIVQATHQLLKDNNKINFIGNIEGRDFLTNAADVIVTDGFTGNILFKFAESFYEIAQKQGINDDFLNKLNYESVGGSAIVGINGNVMIAHGRSSALAIKNMIRWACKQVEAQVYKHITKALN